MGGTSVQPLRPGVAADVDAFYAVYAASRDAPWSAPYSDEELRAMIARPSRYAAHGRFLAFDGGGVCVGWGELVLPQADHLDQADVMLGVHPDHRRRGHGAAILDDLLGRARAMGRRLVEAGADWAAADGLDGTSPGRRLIESRGFKIGLVESHQLLALPATLPDAPVADGYQLRSWLGPCPDEFVDAYAQLFAVMVSESPAGELQSEDQAYDADRVRDNEAQARAMRRTQVTTVAIAPDGSLAGHTQLSVPETDVENAYQWDTLVLPAHRGHGLGLAMKVRNHETATPLLTTHRRVHTWNAVQNAPMLRVNAALGFEVVSYDGIAQRTLD